MATLILTTLGSAIAGPIGGAVGALLGRQADALIFRPAGREGPRLADLRVQTSSYGTQFPALFGTVRVAGTVIWSTDLIERRARRSTGKGRPAVTDYSYAASFAVALSSRAIGGVGRIWADGNLLRGQGGVMLERTGFRLYPGDADQPVDPLIGAALGLDQAPAFRGLAYAVFEELDLAAFGNRIPALTFEVLADPAPVAADQIASELVPGHGPLPTSAGGAGLMLTGYAASGSRVRDALAPLLLAGRLGKRGSGPDWRLGRAEQAGTAALSDAAIGADGTRAELRRQRRSLGGVPQSILLRHYDPARDYQLGQQSAAVPGGGARQERIDLPAVLSAGAAQQLALELARAAAEGRERLTVRCGLGAFALPLGGLVVLDRPAGASWRVAVRRLTAGGVEVELVAHDPAPAPAAAADGGPAVLPPDVGLVAGTVARFDLPPSGDSPRATPQVVIAGAGVGPGWRGADVWLVPAPGAEALPVGTVAAAAALGTLALPLPPGTPALLDRVNVAEVQLANPAMLLADAEMAALLAGANRAMIGGEAVQFAGAEPLGAGRWRLSGLLRGRGGTEDVAGPHPAGSDFVLLGDAALLEVPGELAADMIGGDTAIEWLARGSFAATTLAAAVAGRAMLPLSPVHGRAERAADGGLVLHWIRRSRTGWRWRDASEVPLGEGAEAYRIVVTGSNNGAVERTSAAPTTSFAAAELAGLTGPLVASIRQQGDFGASPPLAVNIG